MALVSSSPRIHVSVSQLHMDTIVSTLLADVWAVTDFDFFHFHVYFGSLGHLQVSSMIKDTTIRRRKKG